MSTSSWPPAGPGRSTSTSSISRRSRCGETGRWRCRRWWRPRCSTAASDATASPTRPMGRDSPCSRFPTTRSWEGSWRAPAARRWGSWPVKRQPSSPSSTAAAGCVAVLFCLARLAGAGVRASVAAATILGAATLLAPYAKPPLRNRCWRSWPRPRCGHWRAAWRLATFALRRRVLPGRIRIPHEIHGGGFPDPGLLAGYVAERRRAARTGELRPSGSRSRWRPPATWPSTSRASATLSSSAIPRRSKGERRPDLHTSLPVGLTACFSAREKDSFSSLPPFSRPSSAFGPCFAPARPRLGGPRPRGGHAALLAGTRTGKGETASARAPSCPACRAHPSPGLCPGPGGARRRNCGSPRSGRPGGDRRRHLDELPRGAGGQPLSVLRRAVRVPDGLLPRRPGRHAPEVRGPRARRRGVPERLGLGLDFWCVFLGKAGFPGRVLVAWGGLGVLLLARGRSLGRGAAGSRIRRCGGGEPERSSTPGPAATWSVSSRWDGSPSSSSRWRDRWPPITRASCPTRTSSSTGFPHPAGPIAERRRPLHRVPLRRASDWHPTAARDADRHPLRRHRQVHQVKFPGGARTQLTFFPDRVPAPRSRPSSGDYFVFAKDTGGNEFIQIYRYDLATRRRHPADRRQARRTAGPLVHTPATGWPTPPRAATARTATST